MNISNVNFVIKHSREIMSLVVMYLEVTLNNLEILYKNH